MELTNKEIKKTRKQHKCEWCAVNIDKYSPAYYRSYTMGNEFNYGYMHLECYNAMLTIDERYFEWTPGDFIRGSIEGA